MSGLFFLIGEFRMIGFFEEINLVAKESTNGLFIRTSLQNFFY